MSANDITQNHREVIHANDSLTGVATQVTATNRKLDVNASGVTTKPTDAYGIQAISNDGTYKYYFFEDSDTNYYVLRKNISTSVFSYVAGSGSYTTVYQSAILGPSGSPAWGTYGVTF